MAKQRREYSTAEFVALLNGLMAAGLQVRTVGYRTHTGDPFSDPWNGPFAYEVYVADVSQPRVVYGADVKRIIDNIHALGFDVMWSHDDEGSRMLQLVPDRIMVRPEGEPEGDHP